MFLTDKLERERVISVGMQLFFPILKVEFRSYYKYITQKTCYKGERLRQEVFSIWIMRVKSCSVALQ